MRWSDEIELPTIVTTYDSYGAPIETTTWKKVFANEVSVRQSEFYQAHGVGLKPEKVFEIWCVEYADQKTVRLGAVVYHVIRTFTKNGEKLELILSRSPLEG